MKLYSSPLGIIQKRGKALDVNDLLLGFPFSDCATLCDFKKLFGV